MSATLRRNDTNTINKKLIDYLSPNIVAEIICFLIACLCLYNDKQIAWQNMVLFMLLTCAAEIIGVTTNGNDQYNNLTYNIFLIAECGFTISMYGYFIKSYTKNIYPVYIALLIFVAVYTYEIIVHGFYIFNNITATTMSVFFTVFSLYYYYLVIKDEKYILLKKHPPFWWVAGGLLFYFGSTTSDLFFSIFKYKTAEFYTYRHLIYICLNLILYTFWSYSFICRYQQRILTR